jgi:hypothetical protein
MTVIRYLFWTLMTFTTDADDSKDTLRLPASVQAEHLRLLLSCGF